MDFYILGLLRKRILFTEQNHFVESVKYLGQPIFLVKSNNDLKFIRTEILGWINQIFGI